MAKKGRFSKGKGGWVFLAAVLLIYGVTASAAPSSVLQALDFFAEALGKVLPALVWVFLLVFLFDAFIDREWIEKCLGRKAGFRGWLVAVMAGILSTGPVYCWYAILGEFRDRGMSTSLAAVFLYGRAVKIPLLPLMVHYFGLRYTVVLSLYLLGFSVLSGLVVGRLEDGPQ